MALSLAQQVEAVAAALDAPGLAVVHTGRNLNADPQWPDQWPNPGKGRRHVRATFRQLLMLSVAHIVGPPIAAAQVSGSTGDLPFRDCIQITTDANGLERRRSFVLSNDGTAGGLPIGATFGDTLAARVEAWAGADRRETMGPYVLFAEMSWPSRVFVPSAKIGFQEPLTPEHRAAGIFGSRYELYFYKDHPTRAELGLWWRSAVLRDELLCALADIWRASATDAPASENANAEALPGASASTLKGDRSRNGETRTEALPTLDPTRALMRKKERASPSGGHPVPLSKGKDPPWPTTTNTTTI